MSLNWKEINLVLDEINLPGSQIQKVFQPAYDIVVFGVYRAGVYKNIFISIAPGACRIHETKQNIPKPEKPLRFVEFLKAHIVNAWIDEAVQIGEERIVKLSLHRGKEILYMFIRLWSNAGNVIVTDDSYTILDVMRRKPNKGEIGGKRYDYAIIQNQEKSKRIYEIRDYPQGMIFNDYIDTWYAEHGTALSLEMLREQVKKLFSAKMERLEASIVMLEKKIRQAEDAELFKEQADIIMANIAAIRAGSEWFQGENFYTGGSITIKLDPQKSAVQNAEHYYELYRKSKSGLDELKKDMETSKQELARMEKEKSWLLSLENPLELHKALTLEVKRKQVHDKKRPGVAFMSNGWLILVGRDASENDELLRHYVKGQDIWLHTRDVPGGYIFIKAKKDKSVPLDVLIDAGNLAVFYSKARNAREADLYYTHVKYLRRAKNGPKGLVIPTQEKNLHIVLDDDRLRKLEHNKCE